MEGRLWSMARVISSFWDQGPSPQMQNGRFGILAPEISAESWETLLCAQSRSQARTWMEHRHPFHFLVCERNNSTRFGLLDVTKIVLSSEQMPSDHAFPGSFPLSPSPRVPMQRLQRDSEDEPCGTQWLRQWPTRSWPGRVALQRPIFHAVCWEEVTQTRYNKITIRSCPQLRAIKNKNIKNIFIIFV